MGLIIDLDMTLIDSSSAEPFRKKRDWSTVYTMIPQFPKYPNMIELMNELKSHGIGICIFTTSPGVYAKKVLEHFKIPYDSMVAYHDAKGLIKPNKGHTTLSLKELGCEIEDAIVVGDSHKDILSGNAAGVVTVGVTWGCEDLGELKKSTPNHIVDNVADLRMVLLSHFGKGNEATFFAESDTDI